MGTDSKAFLAELSEKTAIARVEVKQREHSGLHFLQLSICWMKTSNQCNEYYRVPDRRKAWLSVLDREEDVEDRRKFWDRHCRGLQSTVLRRTFVFAETLLSTAGL